MNAPLPANAVAVAMLPVAAIWPSPTNPRKHFDPAYIADLAESIKAKGLIQPITVRPFTVEMMMDWNKKHLGELEIPPSYEIVVGECRWRAAQAAGMTEIPGFWRELTDQEVLEIQVIENLQRRDVSALEEADGYRLLMARYQLSAEAIAQRIGKSKAYVYARMKLAELHQAGRDAFAAGKLDASSALLVARIHGEALQKKAVKALTTEGYNGEPKSYRDAKYYIHNQFTITLENANWRPDDAELLASAGSCAACPKRSGNDPAIFADIEDADVCTDVKCFDEKKLARRAQLLANAERHKIPVITGEAVTEVMHHQFGLGGFRQDQYVPLDATCREDPEGRTYREILGDDAPVAAVVEFGCTQAGKTIAEVAEPTALAEAMARAGITLESDTAPKLSKKEREAQAASKRAAEQAEEERLAARKAELERRAALKAQILPVLTALPNSASALVTVLSALLRHQLLFDIDATYEMPEALLAKYGHTLPEEYNAGDELPKLATAMGTWSAQQLAAFALEYTRVDIIPYQWKPGQTAELIDPIAEALGLSSPSQAAQAQEDSATPAAPAETEAKKPAAKKGKAKSGTAAPAAPNEPATPAQTSATVPAWPFPTKSRP